MIILDTTVLVYAVGGDHPLASRARAVIDAVGRGDLLAHTTPEVIQEFALVRARRRDPLDATKIAIAYSALLTPLQFVSSEHLEHGLNLWSQHPALGAFDAVLASVAISLDAELLSADNAFGEVTELRWLNLEDFPR